MRWARKILIGLSIATALIAVAIIILLTADLGRFKGNLEDYVSDATGRQFVIAGRFEPSIGDTIDLVVEDVRLANAAWGTTENILELQRLVVSVDTWSLLSGPIDVLNLEVEGLTVHVEKDPRSQQSSWSFGDAPSDSEDSDEVDEPFELPLWLRRARLQNIDINFGQGWLDEPRNVNISDASLSADDSELLSLALSGAAGDEPLRANGLIGPLSALLDGMGPRWELRLEVGDFGFSTDGTFRDLFSLDGPEIHAVMQGPLVERILGRFGLPSLARGSVDIAGDITEGPDGIDLRVEGAFGDLTTEISGRAKSLQTMDNLDLSVEIRGPDLQAIGELFDAGFLPSTGFVVDGDLVVAGNILELQSVAVSAGDARLELDGKLAPTEVDADAQLQLSASGPEVRDFLPTALAEKLPSAAFEVQAIAAGGLQHPQLRYLTAKLDGHELTVEGIVPAAADMTGLDIALAASGPNIDEIVEPWADGDILAEPYSLNTRITNAGAGFVLENLTFELANGSAALTGTSGTLPTLNGMDATIAISGEDLQALIEPWLDVALPDVSFGLNGRFIGARGALQLSNVTYYLGEARGSLDGTTGVLPSLDGLKLNTSVAGPDASRFAELLGGLEDNALLPARDFETRGAISKTSAGWSVNPWALRIGESQLELNGVLGDLDSAAGIDINIALSGPDIRRFLPNRDIDVPVPYEVDGGLRIGETDIELKEVDIRIGKATAWLDGRLPITAAMTNANFDVRVAGPNLERAGKAFNVDGLPPDPFRFEGAMNRDGQAYSVENLFAEFGENKVSGELAVEMGPRIRLTGRLDSEYLNLTALHDQDNDTAEADAETVVRDRVIPDTPLPLEILDLADVDVGLRMRQLVTDHFGVGEVELNVVMDEDRLHVDTTRVSLTNGGNLTASLDLLRTGEQSADVDVSVVAQQFRLRPPVDGDGNPINRPPGDLNLALAASGETVRDLAASADGSISLRQGEGDIDNDFSGYLMRDMVSQVFTAINPLATESKYTRLNCAFLELDVVDGVARSRVVGLQTDKLAVASVGTLNLATEALDFSFRVKQREGIGISLASVINPYFKVSGTLASPALMIDKRRGLVSGTFAALTGGLSILAQGVWDRYLSREDYCQAIIDALDAGEIPVWEGEPESP